MAPPRVVGVIPARWASTRLPGKMLADIAGVPLIVHTLDAARRASSLDEIVVATDDERIASAVRSAGGTTVLTDPALPSGSDRAWAAMRDRPGEIIVNIQGDEPLLPGGVIDATVSLLLRRDDFAVTTAAAPLAREALEDPNAVKVVADDGGRALYFSRAPIPFPRDEARGGSDSPSLFRLHIGLYAFRRETLERFCSWPPSPLERCERLEQLRLLEHGVAVGVADVRYEAAGVDSPEDLERVRRLLS